MSLLSKLYFVQGIFEPVLLGRHVLGPWKMIAYPLNETSWFSTIEPQKDAVLPAFYKTQFKLPDGLTKPLDTYLDVIGWKKVGFSKKNYYLTKINKINIYCIINFIILLLKGRCFCEWNKYGAILAISWTTNNSLCSSYISNSTTGIKHHRHVGT